MTLLKIEISKHCRMLTRICTAWLFTKRICRLNLEQVMVTEYWCFSLVLWHGIAARRQHSWNTSYMGPPLSWGPPLIPPRGGNKTILARFKVAVTMISFKGALHIWHALHTCIRWKGQFRQILGIWEDLREQKRKTNWHSGQLELGWWWWWCW